MFFEYRIVTFDKWPTIQHSHKKRFSCKFFDFLFSHFSFIFIAPLAWLWRIRNIFDTLFIFVGLWLSNSKVEKSRKKLNGNLNIRRKKNTKCYLQNRSMFIFQSNNTNDNNITTSYSNLHNQFILLFFTFQLNKTKAIWIHILYVLCMHNIFCPHTIDAIEVSHYYG